MSKMESEHSQIQELLPWYVNETLTGKDKDLVLRHLGECKACQEERDRLSKMIKHGLLEADDQKKLLLRELVKVIETY